MNFSLNWCIALIFTNHEQNIIVALATTSSAFLILTKCLPSHLSSKPQETRTGSHGSWCSTASCLPFRRCAGGGERGDQIAIPVYSAQGLLRAIGVPGEVVPEATFSPPELRQAGGEVGPSCLGGCGGAGTWHPCRARDALPAEELVSGGDPAGRHQARRPRLPGSPEVHLPGGRRRRPLQLRPARHHPEDVQDPAWVEQGRSGRRHAPDLRGGVPGASRLRHVAASRGRLRRQRAGDRRAARRRHRRPRGGGGRRRRQVRRGAERGRASAAAQPAWCRATRCPTRTSSTTATGRPAWKRSASS